MFLRHCGDAHSNAMQKDHSKKEREKEKEKEKEKERQREWFE